MEEVKVDLVEFVKRRDYIIDFLSKDENFEKAYIYFIGKNNACLAFVYNKYYEELDKLSKNITFQDMYRETGVNLSMRVLKNDEYLDKPAFVVYDKSKESFNNNLKLTYK